MVYSVNKNTMTGIADAVRNMRHEKQSMTPAQIEAKIRASHLGIPIAVSSHIDPDTGEWVRPVEYSNLDAITYADNFDTVYMTYDLTKTRGYGWIGVSVELEDTSALASVERGHLVSGTFVTDASYTMGHDDPFRMTLDDANGDVQLWRVQSESGIEQFCFRTNTVNDADNFEQMMQPCVEITGQLNHLTGAVSDAGNTLPESVSWGTYWLERDSRRLGGDKLTSLNKCWYHCYSLQSLDVSGWNTTNWAVTTLDGCWTGCYLLRSLDLSSWNTTNWAVTTLYGCWASCSSLQSLDVSGWDTTNWAVTTLDDCWASCYSLQYIDLSGWNTTNWAVTTLITCWNGCYSLQSLDLSGWNTTNWAVTTLYGSWNGCYALQSLDVSGWDTTNWAVTTLYGCWAGCMSLQSLDLSGWDTTNWAVTTLMGCWNSCMSLQHLDISGWNTSKWAVTGLNSCWSQCYSLQSLDLSGWNTSKWAVTTLLGCWASCYSLQYIDLSGWNTTNWAVTTLNSCWSNCYSLQSLDLSGWNTTNWAVTNMNSCWNHCYSLQYLDISGWNTSKWAVTDTRNVLSSLYVIKSIKTPASIGIVQTATSNVNAVPNQKNIAEFTGYAVYVNHSYANAIMLTHDSLVSILDRLPAVSAARTITLGQVNLLKLTDEEIAIATDKGWTVK